MTQRFARALNPVWKGRGEACARPELQIAVALMRSNREYPLSATPTWKTTGKLAAQPGAFDFNSAAQGIGDWGHVWLNRVKPCRNARCLNQGLLFLGGSLARLANFECHLQINAIHHNFAVRNNCRHIVDVG